ncbi:MAG TPA: alkaline phosphatase family protein, partial [Polyangiaceae bacterium]|nr:alkaline phosphatase family protein [Polyangiaceae bacterium]
MSTDRSLARLQEIQHIVVLMLENRSFDHMLGYLKQAGMPEVNGLDGTESNPDSSGQEHAVFEWGEAETVFHPALDETGKILDPCHSKACVAEQLADGNRGFITNFLSTRTDRQGKHVELPAEYRAFPMGHYGAKDLPAYDFLARNYCVCDAWHSSVPGDTWPNRLFALAGRESDRGAETWLQRITEEFRHTVSFLRNAPIFDVPAFTRELDDPQWRWYSQDPATLRAADARYRDFADIKRQSFAFFDRQRLSLLEDVLEEGIVAPDSFLDDAARGRLRGVSWIDPNFIDLKVLHANSDDDHPPSDIRAGQELVLEVYDALRKSPDWDDTLLVIVYDEHGGFYDHVSPPRLEFDDGSGYATYGVRVPALIVGPRVPSVVCHELFDHTTLINTILTRFAPDSAHAIAQMGARVGHAKHLGVVLGDQTRAEIPDPQEARARIDEWHEDARA